MSPPPLVLWHGAQRWEGPPELRPSRSGRTAHGPGLYLTTSAETARKYARGPGYVMRFLVSPDLVWLQNATIDLEEALAFVAALPRLKHRQEITAALADNARRVSPDGDRILAVAIVNLLVNYGALTTKIGPLVARFYVDQGIDAELIRQSDEDWVLLFNLDKVLGWRRARPEEVVDVPLVRGRQNPDDDSVWAMVAAKTRVVERRRQRAAKLLVQTGLVSLRGYGRTVYLMLHPSTTIPSGWQVSLFDDDGPFSHSEAADRDEAIAGALESLSAENARAMTEQEFMSVSSTPRFRLGTQRVTFVGLVNTLGHEFGSRGREAEERARAAENYDEAIKILQRELARLRAQP